MSWIKNDNSINYLQFPEGLWQYWIHYTNIIILDIVHYVKYLIYSLELAPLQF
jgi:hypothetical protein